MHEFCLNPSVMAIEKRVYAQDLPKINDAIYAHDVIFNSLGFEGESPYASPSGGAFVRLNGNWNNIKDRVLQAADYIDFNAKSIWRIGQSEVIDLTIIERDPLVAVVSKIPAFWHNRWFRKGKLPELHQIPFLSKEGYGRNREMYQALQDCFIER